MLSLLYSPTLEDRFFVFVFVFFLKNKFTLYFSGILLKAAGYRDHSFDRGQGWGRPISSVIAKLCLLCLLHWYVGSLPLGPEESLPSKLKALSHPWRERKTWKMRGNSDHIPTRICLLTWEGDWISEKSLWIHNKQSVLSIATALLLIMVSLWEQLSPAPWIQLLI